MNMKRPVGRPRKYKTLEEAQQAQREYSRKYYHLNKKKIALKAKAKRVGEPIKIRTAMKVPVLTPYCSTKEKVVFAITFIAVGIACSQIVSLLWGN